MPLTPVQAHKFAESTDHNTCTPELDSPPTVGNTMVGFTAQRSATAFTDLGDWEASPAGFIAGGGMGGGWVMRAVQVGDTETSYTAPATDGDRTTFMIVELPGLLTWGDVAEATGTTPAFASGVVDVDEGRDAFVGQGLVVHTGDPGDHTATWDAPWIELFDNEPTNFSPLGSAAYQLTSDGGTFAAAGTVDQSGRAYGIQSVVLYGEGSADDPGLVWSVYDEDLVFLADLDDAYGKTFRVELNGLGQGSFKINRNSPNVASGVIARGRYIKCRNSRIWGANAIFGFWLERGDFHLIDKDEEGGEEISFAGRGAMAYIDRVRAENQSFVVPDGIVEGGSHRGPASTGNTPGDILMRSIEEWQHANRPADPIPLLTVDFDYDLDSDGNAWDTTDASAEVGQGYVGESGLVGLFELVGTGAIDIVIDPDLGLHAYNHYGRDLTGLAFGAGVVRFVRGVNIADPGATRQVGFDIPATHILVRGDPDPDTGIDVYARAELADAATRPTKEAFLQAYGTDPVVLEAMGLAELNRQLRVGESVPLSPAIPPNDTNEAAGMYLPGPPGSNGHYWIGDSVTLHTGVGPYDHDTETFRIWAITITEDPAANLEVEVELAGFRLTQRPVGVGRDPIVGGMSPGAGPPTSSLALYEKIGANSWKHRVRLATTGPITIATGLNAGDTIDGVVLVAGDRVLVKDQATASQNGIYVVSATPERAIDMDNGSEVLGAAVLVFAGTANAGTIWYVTNTAAVTIDTTAIVWEQFASGSEPITVVAHGTMGATETFDFAAGPTHTGTLDINLTVTLAGAVSGEEAALTLILEQDGSGTNTITWPASVEWPDGVAPTLDQTAGAVEILTFLSVDGGTVWYGFHGGSGGSAITVEDEGTPLATAATTLDFVGAGVTASGVGAEKTITIPGVTAADLVALGVVGPILISDDHSTPIVFADILLTEDGDDILYADLG